MRAKPKGRTYYGASSPQDVAANSNPNPNSNPNLNPNPNPNPNRSFSWKRDIRLNDWVGLK